MVVRKVRATTMIIGLTGYAQSGKDTVAKILVDNYGYTRVAFADKIRELLYEMAPKVVLGYDTHSNVQLMVDSFGWDKAKTNPEIRAMLQKLGMGARKVFGDDFWIKQALAPALKNEKIVVTDVRFTNEANMVTHFGGQIWRVKRLGVEAVNDHISESEMDDYKVDQIFVNNGTIEDLESLVKTRMNGLL